MSKIRHLKGLVSWLLAFLNFHHDYFHQTKMKTRGKMFGKSFMWKLPKNFLVKNFFLFAINVTMDFWDFSYSRHFFM